MFRKSILNIVVILALNVYTFMTGGWILLLFEDMRFHDVDLLTVSLNSVALCCV